MEQSETRDLPGNDASWYHALLVDEGKLPDSAEAAKQQSEPRPEDAISDDEPSSQPIEDTPAATPIADLAADFSTATPQPTADTPGLASSDATSDPILLEAGALAEGPLVADEPLTEDVLIEEEALTVGESAAEGPPNLAATSPLPTPDPDPPLEPIVVDSADALVAHGADSATPTEALEVDSGANGDTAPVATEPPMGPVLAPPLEDPADEAEGAVGRMWRGEDPEGEFDAWKPDEMDDRIDSTRSFRWTSILAALAVIGLIVVGLVLLPSITRSRADDYRESMVTALRDLRAELPDTQESLQTATEPTADSGSLSDLSTQLTVLTARASDLDAVARADLPEAPPFTSTTPVDELAPIQQRLEPLATTAQTVQRRISNLAEYRVLMSDFLAVPEMPTTADTATQADLRVILASTQAESASILAELPSDVSLSEHHQTARSISDEFASWQIDYLEALRTQDPTVAASLLASLQAQLSELDDQLTTPLAQIRRQTDSDLIDLARSIDEVIAQATAVDSAP